MNLTFPFQFDARGRTAESPEVQHVRGLMEQLLFTSPGERVNRPQWGSGVLSLLFAENSGELAAASQLTIHGALQQWLSDVIHVEAVRVTAEESTVSITVQYVIRRTQERATSNFQRTAL